jgi:hypothetical protein
MVLNNERALKRSDSLVVSVKRSVWIACREQEIHRTHTNFGNMAMKEVFIDLPDLSRGTDMYSVVRSLPSWKPSRQ